jgi:hypothetical protein
MHFPSILLFDDMFSSSSNMFLVFCFYSRNGFRETFDRHDYGVSNNIPRHNELQARDEVPTVVKGNQERSKTFTVKEDEMLVSA